MKTRVRIGLNTSGRKRRRGQSLVEVCFMIPWIFFLFVGALDFGFYAYALICVQSAARVAALYTSGSTTSAADQAGACAYVLDELAGLPNNGSFSSGCNAAPLVVTATSPPNSDPYVTGDGLSIVTVKYQTVTMIPIPGVLANQFWIVRQAQMKVRK
jgi:Flp pilus assembly protein TadG